MRCARSFASLVLLAGLGGVSSWAWGQEGPMPPPDPRALRELYQAEREQALKAKFPAEAFAKADALARRAEAALQANNPKAAARYLRDARWQLPYLPAGLPEHVVRVLGGSRLRHSDRVNALAFSPDLTRLASCSKDGTVRVWDLGNGREIVVYRGHAEQSGDPTRAATNVLGVSDVVFHPTEAGVIVSAAGNQVHVWDGVTGRPLRTLLNLGKTDKPIKSLAFSRDGKFLAVGADDGILRVVQYETGKVTFSSPSRNARIEQVAFSPNGAMIAVADSNSQVAVYAPGRPNPLVMSAAGVDLGEVMGVAFTADGGAVLTCGRDGKARLIAGPKPDGAPAGNTAARLREFAGHDRAVTCLATAGGLLVTGGEDTSVRVWEVASGKQLRSFQGHLTRVTAVAYRADGKQIASASEDGAIRLWDLDTDDDHLTLTDAADSLWAVAFSPDGRQVAAAGADRVIRVYDPETGKRLAELPAARSPITSLAYLPDSERLVAAGGDREIVIWDVPRKKPVNRFEAHASAILSVAVSVDGKLIVSGSADRTVKGFDPDADKPAWSWSGRSAVCSVAIGKANQLVAAGLADGSLVVLDVSQAVPKTVAVQAAHVAGVACLAVSIDGSRLASVGGDGQVRIWSFNGDGTLTALARFEGRAPTGGSASPLTGVAFSPDARYVAAVGADRIVHVWDVQTKSQVRGLRGHTDWVTAVAFSPDGRRLASVGVEADRSLRIFELSALDVGSGGGHQMAVNAVAVSPDGRWVATAGTDQTIKIWELATGQEVATLVGNADTPFALAFLGAGSLVMGGSLPTRDGGRLHLWNLNPARLNRLVPTGEVYALSAAPDGKRFVAWTSRPAVGDTVRNNSYESYDAKGSLSSSLVDKGRNIRAVAFTPDLTWAVAGDDRGTVRIWNLVKKEAVQDDRALFPNPIADLGITPDKRRLIAADEQGTLKVVDGTTFETLATVKPHQSGVRMLMVSPTGRSFVTIANDRELRSWSMADADLKNLKPARSWLLPTTVNAVAYTPDGRFLVTANADGSAYVLELPEAGQ